MTANHFGGVGIKVEVGFVDNAFRLDDATNGVLDSSVLHPNWAWTDISRYVMRFSTNIGRQRGLERFSAGTATITLDDSTDRRFDPSNTAGVYYPNVKPGRPVRISATYNAVTYPVWWGFIDAWNASYIKGRAGGGATRVEVRATDGFKNLARAIPAAAAQQGYGELTGARIDRLLDQTDWPDTARTLDPGVVAVIGTDLTQSVLDEMQVTAFSEGGSVYQGPNGNIIFEDSGALARNVRSRVSQATFGDAAGEVKVYDLVSAFDDDLIKNDVTITTVPGKTTRRANTASQSAYGVRSFEITGLKNANGGDVSGLADLILALYAEPELRFDQITLRPQVLPTVSWPQALGRLVHDRITVNRRPPGGGAAISLDCFIEGISHDAEASGVWETKFSLSAATTSVFSAHPFILDDVTFGELDASNVLSF